MNLLLATEQRFLRDPSGAVWTTGGFSFSFFDRYLDVFDDLTLFARVEEVPAPPARALPAASPRVRFAPLPFYLGPWQYARHFPAIVTAANAAGRMAEAILLRLPGAVGSALYGAARRLEKPFGVELVGDPWDVFGPGAIRLPGRPLWRRWFTAQLQRQCASAAAISYVTAKTLQQRYPASPEAFSTHYSSIELPPEAFAADARVFSEPAQRLVVVGSLETPYKGFDTLLHALALLDRPSLSLAVVGSGRLARELKHLARDLHLTEQVCFVGSLPDSVHVREHLRQADLFVMPSRTEGLPRALIEAMACALPCLGSSVGGIPELLPRACLFPPNDPAALASALRGVLDDPQYLTRLSAENLRAAQPYRAELLRARRVAFYQHLALLSREDTPHARPPCC